MPSHIQINTNRCKYAESHRCFSPNNVVISGCPGIEGIQRVGCVAGGFDCAARFNIISMVSPVCEHSEKLTAHTHKPQGGREMDMEKDGRQRNCLVKHRCLKLTVDPVLNP